MSNNLTVERRIILLTSVGSILEYYDFVIYGMLAKYLKTVFFPIDNEASSALQFFLVFAIGYFARPFGGMIVGSLGDRFGRKPAFLFLTILMAMTTLILGFLPSYSQIGFVATTLLILCRLGQGFSFGGELPGAATIVGEFSPLQRRGFRVSLIAASASIGAVLASAVLFGLTHFLDESEIISWGWRIPFIVGGILGLALFLARKNLTETPAFQSAKIEAQQHSPLKYLIYNQTPSILAGIMLTAFVSAMIVSNLYFPYYLNQYFHFPEKSIYFAATLSLVFSAFILPVTGRLADWVPRDVLLKGITVSYLILSYFLFNLLSYQNIYSLILFMMIHQLFITAFSSCYYPMIISLFPPKVRYTGIATCYNLVYAAMGMFPAALTTLLNKFQTPLIMPLVLSLMAGISYIAVNLIQRIERNHLTNEIRNSIDSRDSCAGNTG